MRVVFTRLAVLELKEAATHYEIEFPGLGKRFRKEVRRAADRIAAYPTAWAVSSPGLRNCILHVFPYKLIYSVEDEHLLVIAVAHQHRRPDYWMDNF